MKQILYFTAPFCGPCQQLGPIMDMLSSQVNSRKIDVDQNQDLSHKYNVRNIPCLVLIENGVEKGRKIGYQNKEQILEFYNG
jgi:thioredoxin 1